MSEFAKWRVERETRFLSETGFLISRQRLSRELERIDVETANADVPMQMWAGR
jgi:hypothetical protein